MSCYHPLLYIQSDCLSLDTGKPVGKIIPWIPPENRITEDHYRYIEVPCGKCIGCRLDYARTWATRMSLEASLYPPEEVFFITLTYDDAHLPIVAKNGTVSSTLVKRDVQLFMKSLREAIYPNRIRFFASGEYGDKTNRPHYHLIIFGLKLDDLSFYKKSQNFIYYNSPFIERIWSKGFVVVTLANYQTMNYTARYVVKKLRGADSSIYSLSGIMPPFALMSNRPGIGAGAYDPSYFDKSCIILPGGKSASIPRYFKKIFERLDPAAYSNYTQRNLIAAEISQSNILKYISSYDDYLNRCEFVKNSAINFLNSTKKL